MSVPITISTLSRPINNTACRFGFSTVQRHDIDEMEFKKTLSRIYANCPGTEYLGTGNLTGEGGGTDGDANQQARAKVMA